MNVATAGRQTRDIGRVVDTEVRRYGFSVMRQMFGHGVGRDIHETPSIPSYYEPRCRDHLTDGMVVTIEADHCRRQRPICRQAGRLDRHHRRRQSDRPSRRNSDHHPRPADHPYSGLGIGCT
jgi:methionine aminopeptidase